jgi:FMN-dependent oxidoreductase (nitrilotriacetate monooxygenase family)
MPKKMHFAQFLMHGPTYHSLAMWRHPSTVAPYDWTHPELYQHLGQVCERGLFDMVFFADFNFIFDAYNASEDMAIRYAAQVPCHDPVPLLSWIAAATSTVGVAATVSVSDRHPYGVARLFATLDHLTRGRVGWNVVTSVNRHERLRTQDILGHDERYAYADEFLAVCKQLWQSWEPDAVCMDRSSGIFADPTKVHRLNHVGQFFTSRGPLNVIRSPQSSPVIIQAGASARGRAFAAKHAEAIFAIQPFVDAAATYYQEVKGLMDTYGRNPADCQILFGVQPFVAASEAEARDKQALHNSLVPLEGAVAHVSGSMGYDCSQLSLDEVIAPFQAFRSQGIVDIYTRAAGKTLTVRDMALMHGRSVALPQIVGTPEQVADQLEAYFHHVGGDGFMVSLAYTPGALEDFVTMVIPVLQRRGLYRQAYAGRTLREHLRQTV